MCTNAFSKKFYFVETFWLFFSRGVEYIIEQVEEEQLNDDEFKNAQVLEDIRPISGTARVVLGTLMHQMWVPLIFKAVLYCFSLNETDHEIHEAFARFSCGKNVNILQM